MKRLFLIPLLMGLAYSGYGRTQDTGCILKTSQDLLACALNRHPDIQEADIRDQRDQALIKAARQRINPEVESKVVTADAGNGRTLNTETTLFHTLEIGGKRRARIREAQAQSARTSADALKTQETVALNTVLASHRLRQIQTEKTLLQKAEQSFNSIVGQFRSKPLLSPEQEVSSNLIEAGREEIKLKTAFLLQEESELKSFLEIATGAPYSRIRAVLPRQKEAWPKIQLVSDPNLASSEVQQSDAEKRVAQARAKLARSESWPDLRIGPTIETERQERDTAVLAGGSVSLPLPLLSLNRGNRAYARLEEKRALLHHRVTLQKTAQEREIQRLRYQQALKGLARFASTTKESPIQSLTERGLIPGSLLLEFNRQRIEAASLRHQQELNALEALWRIAIIDGRLKEEKI